MQPSLSMSTYTLTFKVAGMNHLFSDILIEAYANLDPLFLSKDNHFEQFFPQRVIDQAGTKGLRWLSEEQSFSRYQQAFTAAYEEAKSRLDTLLAKPLTLAAATEIISYFITLLHYYAQLDTQNTDRAYALMDENNFIKENLALLAQFKDVARAFINKTVLTKESYFIRFADHVANQFSLTKKQVLLLSLSELLDLFAGAAIKNEELLQRQRDFVIYYLGDKKTYLSGTEAASFIAAFHQEEKKQEDIRGQVANKPVDSVTGTVYFLQTNYEDFNTMKTAMVNMNKGAILVTESTTPELMLACKKAKAIITDMGGMLSHAAIVSRELGIPCIIGTVNATKVLRTGDTVNLDLATGVVTVLSRMR